MGAICCCCRKKKDEKEPLLLRQDADGTSSKMDITLDQTPDTTPISSPIKVEVVSKRVPKDTSGMVIYFTEGDEKKEQRIRGLDISYGEFILLAIRKAGALPDDGSILATWLPPLPPPPKGQKSYTLPTSVDIEKMRRTANEWKLIYPDTPFPREVVNSHMIKVKLIRNPDFVPMPPEPVIEEEEGSKKKKKKRRGNSCLSSRGKKKKKVEDKGEVEEESLNEPTSPPQKKLKQPIYDKEPKSSSPSEQKEKQAAKERILKSDMFGPAMQAREEKLGKVLTSADTQENEAYDMRNNAHALSEKFKAESEKTCLIS